MVRRDLEEAREREEHARAEDELLFSFDNLSVSHTSHPKNSGKKWTEEEKEQLAREKTNEGKTNEEIAGIHERSENAIYMQWNKQKPRDSL